MGVVEAETGKCGTIERGGFNGLLSIVMGVSAAMPVQFRFRGRWSKGEGKR